MQDKVLIILSSSDRDKVITGLMYATNAMKYTWMSEVKVIVFGPSQRLSLQDSEIQEYLKTLITYGATPLTCKYIADQEGLSEDLANLGLDVVYVGTVISEHIKQGFTPMVF
ncbi:MAG: hypothetical protein JRJ48_00240 [Deltaproteobacteria bacterium]|nr:hypothetical protein [Deltaproteobacteria bacterium]